MSYPTFFIPAGDTLPVIFDTVVTSTGAAVTITGLLTSDIEIYKDGSITQRSSDSGIALIDTDGIDIDGTTGIHGVTIDLSDNSDAGFYAVGSWYHVVVASITVNSVTVNRILCSFRIVDIDALSTLTSLAAETRDANVLDQFKRTIAMSEAQREFHSWQPIGNILFVSPNSGDTHANGNRGGITDPYSLVQDCHDNAVTDSNHDTIILLSDASGGATTLTEDVTISKRYTFIRGPGRDFIWTRSGSGDTITVTADGVELSSLQVQTAGSGTGNGVTVTSADHFRAHALWINDTRGDGIQLTDCDNFVIDECRFQGSGASGAGHGLQVLAGSGQTASFGDIFRNSMNDVQGDGIQLDTTGGGTIDAVRIGWNLIEGCTDDGIDIVDSGAVDTFIHDNEFGNNTGNNIEDSGTTTIDVDNEPWSKLSIATEVRLAELDAGNLPTDIAAVPTAAENVAAQKFLHIGVAYKSTDAFELLLYLVTGDGVIVNVSTVGEIDILDRAGATAIADSAWNTGPAELASNVIHAVKTDASADLTAGQTYYVKATLDSVVYRAPFSMSA